MYDNLQNGGKSGQQENDKRSSVHLIGLHCWTGLICPTADMVDECNTCSIVMVHVSSVVLYYLLFIRCCHPQHQLFKYQTIKIMAEGLENESTSMQTQMMQHCDNIQEINTSKLFFA